MIERMFQGCREYVAVGEKDWGESAQSEERSLTEEEWEDRSTQPLIQGFHSTTTPSHPAVGSQSINLWQNHWFCYLLTPEARVTSDNLTPHHFTWYSISHWYGLPGKAVVVNWWVTAQKRIMKQFAVGHRPLWKQKILRKKFKQSAYFFYLFTPLNSRWWSFPHHASWYSISRRRKRHTNSIDICYLSRVKCRYDWVLGNHEAVETEAPFRNRRRFSQTGLHN